MSIDYTKDQLRRAKKLFKVLFPNKANNPKALFSTQYGTKTNTGVINTILSIIFDPED